MKLDPDTFALGALWLMVLMCVAALIVDASGVAR